MTASPFHLPAPSKTSADHVPSSSKICEQFMISTQERNMITIKKKEKRKKVFSLTSPTLTPDPASPSPPAPNAAYSS